MSFEQDDGGIPDHVILAALENPANEIHYDDPAADIPNFRCNARVFFLTYPRCTVPSGDALSLLSGLIGDRLQFICVGHELHKDGGDHLHVVFQVKVCCYQIVYHSVIREV